MRDRVKGEQSAGAHCGPSASPGALGPTPVGQAFTKDRKTRLPADALAYFTTCGRGITDDNTIHVGNRRRPLAVPKEGVPPSVRG